MVDPELVAVGAEAQARLTDLGVMPEPGGEGEEPQPDAPSLSSFTVTVMCLPSPSVSGLPTLVTIHDLPLWCSLDPDSKTKAVTQYSVSPFGKKMLRVRGTTSL